MWNFNQEERQLIATNLTQIRKFVEELQGEFKTEASTLTAPYRFTALPNGVCYVETINHREHYPFPRTDEPQNCRASVYENMDIAVWVLKHWGEIRAYMLQHYYQDRSLVDNLRNFKV